MLDAHGLHHAGLGLGGHGHKGKLVGVGRLLQAEVAQLPVVDLSGLVSAACPGLLAADGAYPALHRAAHAHFLFDAAVDLGNQSPIVVGTHHVGSSFQPAVGIARLGDQLGLLNDLGGEDPGGLSPSRPVVVENAALAQKQRGQSLQSLGGKPLKIPIHFVVAQPHREDVHLLGGEGPFAPGVDELQLLGAYPLGLL